MIRAVLWDVDGTLAETERDGHLVAFNQAFEALGLPWRWSAREYGGLLAITGGRERLLYDLERRPNGPVDAESRAQLAARAHYLKNEAYADLVSRGGIPLRDGVVELFDECAMGRIPMAIVTTTSERNVDALLRVHLGAAWRSAFVTVIAAEQAPVKKPDPQAYRTALTAIGRLPSEVIAVEDSPAGVAAARAMSIPVIVTRSHYFADADVPGALAVGSSLGQRAGWVPALQGTDEGPVTLNDFSAWHALRSQRPEPTVSGWTLRGVR